MQAIARALLQVLEFIDLSPDNIVDPDAAGELLEQIADMMQEATPKEVEALEAAAMSELNQRTAADAPEEVLDFYEHILEDLGLEEPSPDDPDDE